MLVGEEEVLKILRQYFLKVELVAVGMDAMVQMQRQMARLIQVVVVVVVVRVLQLVLEVLES